MSSQSILTTAVPNDGKIDVSLAVVEILIDVRNYIGWGFDITIESADAEGSLYLYSQYTNFETSLVISDPDVTAAIVAGTFIDGSKKLIIDNNNLITRGYLLIKWLAVTPGTGFLEIKGLGTLRG